MAEALIKTCGVEESKQMFLWVRPGESENYPEGREDNTRFSPREAEMMARLVVMGIREAELGITECLKE